MGATRTLLRRQPARLDDNGHARRRKPPGQAYRKIILEENQGRVYRALHATKGWRMRTVPLHDYLHAMAGGGSTLARLWDGFRRMVRPHLKHPNVRSVRGGAR